MQDDDSDSTTISRLIETAIVEAHQARTEYWMANGDPQQAVTAQHIQGLRNALIRYFDALQRYREKNVIKEDWQEHDFDRLGDIIHETRTVSQSSNRIRGGQSEAVEVSIMQDLSPSQLIQYINQLDDLATKLGFMGSVREQLPKEKGTIEDIRWLLSTRGQSTALDDLEPPANDRGDLPT